MKHVWALAVKLVVSFVLLWIILGGFYNFSTGDVFSIALVLGIVSYLVGDLFILKFTNNTTATIADFILSLFVIWIMSANLTPFDNLFTLSLVASIGVAVCEYFYHKYVESNVLDNSNQADDRTQTNLRYQTETSEEFTDFRRNTQDDE